MINPLNTDTIQQKYYLDIGSGQKVRVPLLTYLEQEDTSFQLLHRPIPSCRWISARIMVPPAAVYREEMAKLISNASDKTLAIGRN